MSEHIDGPMLSGFLDGALSAAERSLCDGHLSSCSSCRGELNDLRHLKAVVSSAARKTMPADLVLSLERTMVSRPAWWKTIVDPGLWIPLGATAAAALAVGLWLQGLRASDEIPLEPLLAAHARYSAEGLVPQENLVASTYSDQLVGSDLDSSDAELQ